MVSDIANVVLVHGAWADGSSWNKVIAGLRARGIASVAAPLPLTTLADDMVALFVRLFVAKHKIHCRCVSLERATEKRINARTDTLSRTREGGSPHQRYWKTPIWTLAVTRLSLIRSPNGVARFGNMNLNYSRPNEFTQDVEISAPRPVRIVRTVRIGLPATAMASTLRTDTSSTKSKESSFQIAEFVIDHPILAMLVLGLIALIGSIFIFALPIGWLPF